MRKRLLKKFVLGVILAVACITLGVNKETVHAYDDFYDDYNDEYEDYEYSSAQNYVVLNQPSYLNKMKAEDFIHFTVSTPGRIKVVANDCNGFSMDGEVWKSWNMCKNDIDILSFRWKKWNSEKAESPWISVTPGDYCIKQWEGVSGRLYYGYPNVKGTLTIVFEEKGLYIGENEPNDKFDDAEELVNGKVIEGDGCSGEDIDYYKFVMTDNGNVVFNIDSQKSYIYVEDSNLNVSDVCVMSKGENKLRLPKGVYYVGIGPVGDYKISANITYEDSAKYETEFNDTSNLASNIETNTWYIGNFNASIEDEYGYEDVLDDIDYYKFTVNKKSDVTVQLKIPRQAPSNVNVILYDEDLNTITKGETSENPFYELKTCTLDAGTYYVKLIGDYMLGDDYQMKVLKTPHRELNKKSISGWKGDTVKLSLTNGNGAKWKSSNKKVATVNNKGIVTIKGPGKANIIASIDGREYVCKVTIDDLNKKAHTSYKDQLYSCACDLGEDVKYTFIDLNSDGIDELIVYPGYGYWTESIYTFNRGKTKKLLSLGQGEVEKYFPSTGVLYAYYGHMGHYVYEYYKIENGKAVSKAKILKDEVVSGDNISYKYTYYVEKKKVSKAKYNSYVKKLEGSKKAKSLNYSKIKWKKYRW